MPRFDTLRRFGRRSTGDAAVARSLDRWLDGDPVAEAASNSDRTELAALQRSATALFELAAVAEGATTRPEVELRRDGWSRLMASAPTTKLTPLPASSVSRGRTRAGAWTTAAAIVAVVVLLGAALRGVVEPGNGGEGDQAPSILTAASPTAPSGAVDDEIAGRGGADRAWNFSGSLSPNLGQPVPLEVAGYQFRTISNAQVFGDLLVVQDVDRQGTNPTLLAVDLRSDTVAWTQNVGSSGGFASDGERLVLREFTPTTYGLLALDLATGSVLWRYADTTATEAEFFGAGPILFDDTVYMNDGSLTMFAVNATDGTLLWSASRQAINREGDDASRWSLVQFAVDDEFVYMVREDRIVEGIDRRTGESRWQYVIDRDFPTRNYAVTRMLVSQGYAYLAAYQFEYLPAPQSSQVVDEFLIAIDSRSGEESWRRTDLLVDGGMTVSHGTLYVPVAEALYALDAQSGDELARSERGANRAPGQAQLAGDLVVLPERVGEGSLDVVTVFNRGLMSPAWSWRKAVDLTYGLPGAPGVVIWDGSLIIATIGDGLLIATENGEATGAASPETG